MDSEAQGESSTFRAQELVASAGRWWRAAVTTRSAACAPIPAPSEESTSGSVLGLSRDKAGFLGFRMAQKEPQIRLPSDIGSAGGAWEFEGDQLSPRPHEPPSGYRGWYQLKLGETWR